MHHHRAYFTDLWNPAIAVTPECRPVKETPTAAITTVCKLGKIVEVSQRNDHIMMFVDVNHIATFDIASLIHYTKHRQ